MAAAWRGKMERRRENYASGHGVKGTELKRKSKETKKEVSPSLDLERGAGSRVT